MGINSKAQGRRIALTHMLATGIAFHCLSLAIPGEMIGTTTLVAGRDSGIPGISTAEGSHTKSSTNGSATPTGSLQSGSGTVSLGGIVSC